MGGFQRPFTPWKKVTVWRREISCPNPSGCNAMAGEQWEEGAKKSSGVCTECGHHWKTGVLPDGPLRPPPITPEEENDRG